MHKNEKNYILIINDFCSSTNIIKHSSLSGCDNNNKWWDVL